jgi:hypothetical protein
MRASPLEHVSRDAQQRSVQGVVDVGAIIFVNV